jgi:BatD DUF11 like domain
MTKAIGNTAARWGLLVSLMLLALGTANARAELTAGLDRNQVAMGDTLRLTITATGSEELSDVDLRPLNTDFEILRRSTSSNTRWINGKRTHTRQLLIDITPRREGTLQIPPLREGQHATNMLLVAVGPAPSGSGTDQSVLFEAELDQDSVYVQGQVILTLRLQQAINLEDRSITELKLENAFVRPLEQKSFQRTMNGRPWLVHEVRYAIFPEHSGTLDIPAQTFSGRESSPRRSFFDMGGGGRSLRRTTESLQITVLPRPATFPDATWLPARTLTLEESWSTPPEQLRAGESATRTIRIQAEGLQGAQLPPVLFPATDGLKYYPDQPVIGDTESTTGLLGSRVDSAALVPTRAGSWQIPELRIPWWDTQAGEVRYAVLPGREITVAAADPATNMTTLAPSAAPPINIGDGMATVPVTPVPTGDVLRWQIFTAVSASGWLLTLAYLLWSRRRPGTPDQADPDHGSEKQAYKHLLQVCAGGSAQQVRQGLIAWTAALFPQASVVSLSQAAALLADTALTAQLDALNTALYSEASGQWDGSTLAACVKRLRSQHRNSAGQTEPSLELYPRAA